MDELRLTSKGISGNTAPDGSRSIYFEVNLLVFYSETVLGSLRRSMRSLVERQYVNPNYSGTPRPL